MITEIIKRNGRIESFNQEKIVHAIYKAATACGGSDYERAEEIGRQVIDVIQKKFRDKQPDVESIQDIVEKVLIENGHAKTAKAFILYRQKGKAPVKWMRLLELPLECFPTT